MHPHIARPYCTREWNAVMELNLLPGTQLKLPDLIVQSPITVSFHYKKKQVLQALRYHFLSKREIRVMIILVNVFALASATLFYFHRILPFAFAVGSILWFVLMLSFWFFLPGMVYRRAATFRDHFIMKFEDQSFSVGNERYSKSWPWDALSHFMETPHFFHLYFDHRSFFLVPKDSFEGDMDVFNLRKLLREKVKQV